MSAPITPTAPRGYTTVKCSILHETFKAILVSIKYPTTSNPDKKLQFWIPSSQVHYTQRNRFEVDHSDFIIAKDWILSKNGYTIDRDE